MTAEDRPGKIQVLVVDDSAYLRKVVSHMLRQSPRIEVVGTARDGRDALEKVETLRPDVVTLDLTMPVLDGVGFLEAQRARGMIPVVVVSIASRDGKMAMRALEAGALDFVRKPTALAHESVLEITEDLIERVTAAAEARLRWTLTAPAANSIHPPPIALTQMGTPTAEAVVIALSTGGPHALRYLVPRLPANLPVGIAVVLHMPEGYTHPYAVRLDEASSVEVLEAEEGMEMRPGRLIIGRAGRHLKLRRDSRGGLAVSLSKNHDHLPYCPSGDVLFESAAQTCGDQLLGVVMTGMGNDATQGSAWVKSRGGRILVESESTCVVYGMPRSVLEAGLADGEAPLDQLPARIMEALGLPGVSLTM